MRKTVLFSVVLPVAALLLFVGTQAANAQKGGAQLSESQQMRRETYLGKDTTLKTALVGSVTVGYASKSDYDNDKRPVSPTITLVRGASITHTLTVTHSSKVFIRGGRIGYRERNFYGGEVLAGDTSSVVFTGGTAYTLSATQQSIATLTGGTILSSILVGEQGTMNVKGGMVKGDFIVGPGGTLNLFGANLSKRRVRRGEAGYDSTRADQEEQYVLSGTLRDGTSIAGKTLRVGRESGSKVNFIQGPLHD